MTQPDSPDVEAMVRAHYDAGRPAPIGPGSRWATFDELTDDFKARLFRQMRAALAVAPKGRSISDGDGEWALVPKAANLDMERAAVNATLPYHGQGGAWWDVCMPGDFFRIAWQAMLAARPTPPAGNSQDCPMPGEIRVIDGKRYRFIERELEGDKWEPLDSTPPAGDSKSLGQRLCESAAATFVGNGRGDAPKWEDFDSLDQAQWERTARHFVGSIAPGQLSENPGELTDKDRIEAARKALEPFAEALKQYDTDCFFASREHSVVAADEMQVLLPGYEDEADDPRLTVGDLRRAAEAYALLTPQPGADR